MSKLAAEQRTLLARIQRCEAELAQLRVSNPILNSNTDLEVFAAIAAAVHVIERTISLLKLELASRNAPRN